VLQQFPAKHTVSFERSTAQRPTFKLMRALGRRGVFSAPEFFENALVHLGCRFSRKSYSNDFFRAFDRGEQGKNAICEQLGFT
jgi:hypothetical protein